MVLIFNFQRTWIFLMFVILVLTLICSTTEQASLPRNNSDESADNVWLSDETFYDEISLHDTPQGDQALPQAQDLCPPVPAKLPQGSCHAPKCTSDRECAIQADGEQKCCYNGCIYTCLPELAPPAFIDWIREPKRRLRSGLSWLVNGPDKATEEEVCSTTPVEEDADPLICPHGYYCSIFDDGDPAKGVPNLGTCVRLRDGPPGTEGQGGAGRSGSREDDSAVRDKAEDYDEVEKADGSDSDEEDGGDGTDLNLHPPVPEWETNVENVTVWHEHACDLDGRMLLDGHEADIDGKFCICKEKELFCEDYSQDV